MPSPLDPASLPVARSAGRPLAFGFTVGGLSAAAFLIAGVVRLAGSVAVPVIPITALLLVAATPLIRRQARWAGTPRPDLCAAWSLLGVLPLLFLGAKFAIGNDPVLSSHWRCGSGDIGLAILSPIPFALLGTLAGLLAFIAASSREWRGTHAGLRILSRGALLLGALLVGAAALRAAHKPSTDQTSRYLDALPTIAVLPPPVADGAKVPAPVGESGAAMPNLVDETRFGDIIVRRICSRSSCAVALRRVDRAFPPERMLVGAGSLAEEAEARIQRDEKHGFWIVGGQVAFRDEDLLVTSINIQDIGDELSAPPGWILGGAAGVLVALALGYRRHRLAQRLLQIEAATAGVLGDSGWITFDDDRPARRASPDVALAPGPVLLVGRGTGGGAAGAYRADGQLGGSALVAGERDDLRAALRARLAGLDALGLVAVLLTAAPLVASWTSGLLLSWD